MGPEQITERGAERRNEYALRMEGEKIYTEEFVDKLDEVLGHQFKGGRKEKIVLRDTVDKYSGEFNSEEFSQKSPQEQSEVQRKFIQELVRKISGIPHDSWSINFRQAMENNSLNCSNCATLTGLILERVGERARLQNVEYGHPCGHAIDIITLADGRVLYVDSRNNVVENLELGENALVEDRGGLKVYKINRLKGRIDYKIIPVMPVKEGSLSVYLGNLQVTTKQEPSRGLIGARSKREQEKFSEGARRVYKEEGLFDEEKGRHLREMLGVFNQKLAEYEESEEFKAEIKRWEASENRDIERARREVGDFFDAFDDGHKRIDAILSRVELFLSSDLIDGEKIRQLLDECSAIKEREEFIDRTLAALRPLIELRKNNPKAFEKIERETFTEGQIRINEILSYGIDGDIIHIHLAPARQLGIGKLRKLVREGLEELAKTVRENEDIVKITATSWIVAKNSKLMKNLGFTVEGEIDEETRQRYFAGDERKISRAVMSREEFLARYLQDKKSLA